MYSLLAEQLAEELDLLRHRRRLLHHRIMAVVALALSLLVSRILFVFAAFLFVLHVVQFHEMQHEPPARQPLPFRALREDSECAVRL